MNNANSYFSMKSSKPSSSSFRKLPNDLKIYDENVTSKNKTLHCRKFFAIIPLFASHNVGEVS